MFNSVSVQFSSAARSCPTLCDHMNCSTPGLPVHHQLLEFTQTHVHRVSDAIQLSHPLLPPSPFAFNLSQHQDLFKWVDSSQPHGLQPTRLLRPWDFPGKYSGLISFRIDWFDPLAVQGTHKSLLQHHSLKAQILQPPAFSNSLSHTWLLEKP